jgi:hypothetical protein
MVFFFLPQMRAEHMRLESRREYQTLVKLSQSYREAKAWVAGT